MLCSPAVRWLSTTVLREPVSAIRPFPIIVLSLLTLFSGRFKSSDCRDLRKYTFAPAVKPHNVLCRTKRRDCRCWRLRMRGWEACWRKVWRQTAARPRHQQHQSSSNLQPGEARERLPIFAWSPGSAFSRRSNSDAQLQRRISVQQNDNILMCC